MWALILTAIQPIQGHSISPYYHVHCSSYNPIKGKHISTHTNLHKHTNTYIHRAFTLYTAPDRRSGLPQKYCLSTESPGTSQPKYTGFPRFLFCRQHWEIKGSTTSSFSHAPLFRRISSLWGVSSIHIPLLSTIRLIVSDHGVLAYPEPILTVFFTLEVTVSALRLAQNQPSNCTTTETWHLCSTPAHVSIVLTPHTLTSAHSMHTRAHIKTDRKQKKTKEMWERETHTNKTTKAKEKKNKMWEGYPHKSNQQKNVCVSNPNLTPHLPQHQISTR